MSIPSDHSPPRSTATPAPAASPLSGIAGRELGGDMPCVNCGYNLRGLSIRAMCPECGVGVRATILSIIDPQASELQPVRWPRLLAAGLVAWVGGAAAAAALSWLPHAADLAGTLGLRVGPRPNVALGVVIGLIVSGVASLVLVRPHARIAARDSILAALGSLLYIPLVWLNWLYYANPESPGGLRFLTGWPSSVNGMQILAGNYALVAAIILSQRPVARLLVARSLIMRSGRVDRQTLYAIAVAAGCASIGLVMMRVASDQAGVGFESLRIVGLMVVAISGLFVTLGLFGALLDGLRIAQAVLTPRRTLKQIIREGGSAPRSRLGKMLDGSLAPPAVPQHPPSERARP